MKHVIAGVGEVGKALLEVLSVPGEAVRALDIDTNQTSADRDFIEASVGLTDVLHVAFPCTDQDAFVAAARAWQTLLKPEGLTIVHSTVPRGTCERLGAVHSPVRGVHPKLAEGIRTFAKFFGGPRAEEAAAIFAHLGIPVRTTPLAATTEAAKLWDTTAYGVMIALEKEIHEYCERFGLDFDVVYAQFTDTYNVGYRFMGRPEVARPILKHVPGPIGGHCVVQNCELLGDSPITRLVVSAGKE